jgi:hypothetical protein
MTAVDQTGLGEFGGGSPDEPDREHGGGPHTGLSYVLNEIIPETLPDDGDPWPEVRHRVQAAAEGLPGWRTGATETTLDEAAGGERDA